MDAAVPTPYLTLPELITWRAGQVANSELEMMFPHFESRGEPWDRPHGRQYLQVELAVRTTYRDLTRGDMVAYVRDPASQELLRILPGAWRGHSLHDQTLRRGVIHAAACDPMQQIDGATVLVERSAVEDFTRAIKRRKPTSMKRACQDWLEGLLRANPHQRSMPKAQMRDEAVAKFGVTWRQFDACWQAANQAVPEATWRRPGAPKKS